ncbi:MAG: hypothetical protein FJ265_11555 [Planctomycetes bacterium]|nr:hypothetical protein [Planctomycetota bacterium]
MHRSLVVALILLLAAALGLWLWSRGEATPPPPSSSSPLAENPAGPAESALANAPPPDSAPRAAHREAVAAAASDLLDDPEIRAGLSGFKGRVVTHGKQPVADCGVRIYRGAMDSILPDGVDLFAEEPSLVPRYVAGETRTQADGTFLLAGVWPRAFYVMFAGIGTDAPMHQLLSRTPSPGEVVDLGDVVLPDAGVITGIVLGDDGEPLAGALVRAADLPGSLAAFFPVERFDPEGAVLVREPQAPMKVVEMPGWVKSAFEHMPIPTTHSGADGRFRLVGVVPGSNLLATTKAGWLSDMKPSVAVRAGQVKDVGRVQLKRGEELEGRVLDTAGKPVAGAEVFAGSTIAVAPVDLAQRLQPSDAEGRFRGEGFAPGKVTVAARAGRGHPWVLAEPQPILGEVTVVLPATFGADVSVTLADGKPAKDPRFCLLQGRAGDGAAELAVFGFAPPIDLRDRMKATAEGRWRIDGLAAGRYTLVADAPGHATGCTAFDVATADAAVQLQLAAKKEFAVRVVDTADKPVKNAAIYAESSGRGRNPFDMPLACGRTKADGRLVIDRFDAETLRVSADHPRWGVVHGEAKLGAELVLVMQAPGSLHGVLTEDGKPAEPGKYTIALERRRGGGPRGPLEDVPGLLSSGAGGQFTAAALQPGSYRLHVIKSLDALRSPGGVFGFAQDMFLARDTTSETVEVQSGQRAEVQIETGQKPIEGPTARLSGTITVDGKVGAGHAVTAYGNERRFSARADDGGRFDFGIVPAGQLHVAVMGGAEGSLFGRMGGSLWSGSVTLQEAEQRELTIVVATSSLGGVCVFADGSPAPGVFVQARGRLAGAGQDQGEAWLGEPTDAQGRFRFAQVAAGTWSLEVRGGGEQGGRGKLEGITVAGGIPNDTLRIELTKGLVVKGRIDLAALGGQKPEWCWVGFYNEPEDGGAGYGDWAGGAGVNGATGEFSTDDLVPGRYRVRLHTNLGEGGQTNYRCDTIDVPPGGLQDVHLRAVLER